ncbi:Anaphase-promoting complex subunit 1 [Pseudolycoriella hygida]|uniref:Anaphase-promoting complex subunit 1 n=1 Tax=Pseudolycoriella hygida TaxID=35572 RepID=A0A9Q0RZ45_9DIPT|nr:Anaphase-promoting complex subunit 1 [Pseudolycoriella hygida]
MIASEPLEFIPRGRQAVEDHPGPLVSKKQINIPSEHLLLHRLQNVNISSGDSSVEGWAMREMLTGASSTKQNEQNNAIFITESDIYINSEEELYFKGHTAVWSKGIASEDGEVLPRICFTCDTPIKHAFFCSKNFIKTVNPDKRPEKQVEDDEDYDGICLIDSTSLRVYLTTGEDYVASLEFPVSNTWSTRYGVLLEKNASVTTIDVHSIAMPRLFSLTHPLDEMCPVLIKTNTGSLSYLTDNDLKVIFVCSENDLVLIFDNKTGKHFVSKLRKASIQEANSIAANDTMVSGLYNSTHHIAANISSVKLGANLRQNISMLSKTYATRSPMSSHTLSNQSGSSPMLHTSSNPLNRSFVQSPLLKLHTSLAGQSFSAQDLRKVGQPQPSVPIIPELCLDHVWTENVSKKEYYEMATHGFIHVDLIDQTYLCYVLARSNSLQLMRLEKSNTADTPIFGMITSVPAKDAVCLDKLKMIAVLAPCGTLMIYSGPHLIGKVHVGGALSNLANVPATNSFSGGYPRRSSLLPSSQEARFEDGLHMLSPVYPIQSQFPTSRNGFCSGLRDPTGNRLTLVYPGGKMYRISVPFICECPFITKCLIGLKQVLKKDVTIQLFAKWFVMRNAPGSKNLNPRQEWSIFRNVLLELMGRPTQQVETLDNSISKQFTAEPKKRRKTENLDGSDTDWEYLDQILNHKKTICSSDLSNSENDSTALLFPYIPLIFFTMHLIYEEIKLDALLRSHQSSLAEFLYLLAMDLQLDSYCLHYFLDEPHLVYMNSNSMISDGCAKKFKYTQYLQYEVPNIFRFVCDIINKKPATRYPFINLVNDTSKKVVQLVNAIVNECGIDEERIELLHFGSKESETQNLPSKQAPESGSKSIVHCFIDLGITRQDIEKLPTAVHFLFAEALEVERLRPPIEIGAKAYELLLRSDLLQHTLRKNEVFGRDNNASSQNPHKEHSLSPKTASSPIPKPDCSLADDGMEHIYTKLLQLRFPEDLRIVEIRRLLSSSRPVFIDIVQAVGVSDHDFIEEQEKQLFAMCTRTMALPMGRGMFTLRTCTPTATEILTVPKLCLSGKESVKGATIELQQIEVPPNMSVWPMFHNGVAAGLQITPTAKDIDSTWIVYNKPKTSADSSEHAGFLLGLGLNGHLKTLSFLSIYEYSVKCDEMTSVGLFLGVAAAYRGTMDSKITKLLSVHIEALLPPTSLELDIQQNIQVASIMGIGLLYQETAKRHIAEILLQEIGRPPGPEMENCVERESYALASGLALGLVTLGKGESPPGLRDLHLPDTLHYYMIGGNKRPLTGAQKEKYKLPSFQVREGDTVNIDVTAPGATIALGLMFFKTGNEAVAHWMKPPDTNYLLNLVRPDLLLLRIIARGLILWDSIEPTKKWIIDQVPGGLFFDLLKAPKDVTSSDVDHEANCQACCNITAGAAFCIGLRYAGTEDPTSFYTLNKILKLFLGMESQFIGEFAGKATVESCLVLVVLSMSLVFAGTGNIEILRVCRMLRSRLGASNTHVTYGSHMAIHMAIGFLFLGAGRFTLSRSPQAIAALVCALFPKFPTHSNDNRYHLQAFRHLYTIAVEPRILLPRNIDTGKLCLTNVSYVALNSDNLIQLPIAPCILPELVSLKAVVLNDANYWPVFFEKGKNWEQLEYALANCFCIDIKQKAGCLSHLEDPNRLKSLLVQTLTSEQYSCWKIKPETLLKFSQDAKVQHFTNKFLRIKDNPTEVSTEECQRIQIFTLQFYNCLTKDKMHGLPLSMDLLRYLERVEAHSVSNYDLWQLKIVSLILKRCSNITLLSPEICKSFSRRLVTSMEQLLSQHIPSMKRYLFSSNATYLQETDPRTALQIAILITFYDLPINIMNVVHLGGQLNYSRMLLECKKVNLDVHTVQCMFKMLNVK